MQIDLRRFIDVNIQEHLSSEVSGTRDTVVLFTDYGTEQDVLIESLEQAKATYYESGLPKSGAEVLVKYLETYFNNNGCKVLVKQGTNALTADMIAALEDKYICIASTSTTYSGLEGIADDLLVPTRKIYGIKEKMIFARTTEIPSTNLQTKNFVVKYSSKPGAEMTILAYLSRIDVYKTDSVYDYAFTQEVLDVENISDSVFEDLMERNVNVNISLANASRVCGGNCMNGTEIVNNYVRIILHQTLTAKLLNVLSTKLTSTTGVAQLYTAISQEMKYYLSNNYLTTDKVWSDETLSKKGADGKDYVIVEKGTPLIDGYVVKILPMSALSDADKSSHKAPPIYLVIADQYAIRKITLSGEVI